MLIGASLSCGGLAAIEMGGACRSQNDCGEGSRCEAGQCAPSGLEPSGAAASGGRGGVGGVGAGTAGSEGTASGGAASGGTTGLGGAAGGAASEGSSSAGATGSPNGSSPGALEPDYPLLPIALPGATALASDPVRDRIYVAVGAGPHDFADSIVSFDPDEGSIVASVVTGGNPTSLAISDDGTTLWVGLHDRSSLLALDVSGEVPVIGTEYALPPSELPPYPLAAGPMVVLPGTTSSVAVSLHFDGVTPSLAGVVVLDEGVPRPRRLPSHTGASRLTLGPEGYLLGYNNLSTGFEMFTIAVSPEGLTQTAHQDLIAGFSTDIVYEDTWLFGTDGAVVRVTSPEYPLPLAALPVTGAIFPDMTVNVVWVLQAPQTEGDVTPVSLVLVSLPSRVVVDTNRYGSRLLAPRHFVRSTGGVFAFIADRLLGDGSLRESGVHWMRP